MCEVVNFKQYGSVTALNRAFGDEWVYIGRANSQAGLAASPLANPYKVRAFGELSRADYGGQRGATLADYRRWLWARIQAGDTAVLAALRGITAESALVCWCKPGPCHGDVVKAAAEWLRAHEDMRAQEGKQHIVFVSGHRDLSVSEFYAHYQARLDKAVAAGSRHADAVIPGRSGIASARHSLPCGKPTATACWRVGHKRGLCQSVSQRCGDDGRFG